MVTASGEAFRWSDLDDLTARELHDLLKLRLDVFVVEQACAYAELDGLDPSAHHLRCLRNGALGGYLRLLPPLEDRALAIGRVVVAPPARSTGLGERLMDEALRFCGERYPGSDIRLSAQAHLVAFYARHGFAAVSDVYLEDGIAHIDMHRASA